MRVNLKNRTKEEEEMDDFGMEGSVLKDALDKLAKINKVLGGNSIIISGLKSLLKSAPEKKVYTIADLGCGNGDMLREVARYAGKNNIKVRLLGFDANSFTIKYAEKLSENYPDIQYSVIDLFSEEFKDLKYDIAITTLTLHHFDDETILKFLPTVIKNANLGVIINDLHRSKTAYYLFQLIAIIFRLNKMSKNDGLISIKRGFRKKEIEKYSADMCISNYSLQWKWAFRYQWIIRKI